MAQSINIWAATGENAELSNFAIRPFELESSGRFQSVEQAFQFAKVAFSSVRNTEEGERIRKQILATTDGAELRELGRSVPGLNISRWNANSSLIMETLIKKSFQSNPDALARLLDTGDAGFTHRQDNSKWREEFPRILARVRDELRYEQREASLLKTDEEQVDRFNVVTLGIGTMQQDEFFALIPENVDVVIDARNSLSGYRNNRWRDSSEMRARLERAGMQYVTAPAFSNRSRNPEAMIDGNPKRLDYSVIEAQDDYKASVEQVERFVRDGKRVLIIGSESNPAFSSRALSVGQVLERDNISVGHISVHHNRVDVSTQEQVVSRSLGRGRGIVRGDYTQIHFNSDRTFTADPGCLVAERHAGTPAEARMLAEVGNYGRRVDFVRDDGIADDGNTTPADAFNSAHRSAVAAADFSLIISAGRNDPYVKATKLAAGKRSLQIPIPEHKEDLYDEDRINHAVREIQRRIGYSLAAAFADPNIDIDVNNIRLNVAGSHIARIANSFVPATSEENVRGVKEGFHVDDLSGITQEDVDFYCRELITRLTNPQNTFEFEDRSYPWHIGEIVTTGQTGVEESVTLAAQGDPRIKATVIEPVGDWVTLDNETIRGTSVADKAAFRNRFNLGLKKEVTDEALIRQIDLQEFKRDMADNGMATGLSDRQILALRLCGLSNNDINTVYEQSRRSFVNADGETVGQSYNTPADIMDLIDYCAGYGVDVSGGIDEILIREKLEEAARITDDLRKMGVSYVTVNSPDYPSAYRDMPDRKVTEYRTETVRTESGETTEAVPYEVTESRPAIIFYKGTLDVVENPGVALFGAHTSSEDAIRAARAAANIFNDEDVAVVANMNETAPRSALIEQMEHGGTPVGITSEPLGGAISYDASRSRLTEAQMLCLHYAGYSDADITKISALSNRALELPDGSVQDGTFDNNRELMSLLVYARDHEGIAMPGGFKDAEIAAKRKALEAVPDGEQWDGDRQALKGEIAGLEKDGMDHLKRCYAKARHDIKEDQRASADGINVDGKALADDIAHSGGVVISENAKGVPEKKSNTRSMAYALKPTGMMIDGALNFGSGELLGGALANCFILPYAVVDSITHAGKAVDNSTKKIKPTESDLRDVADEAQNAWETDVTEGRVRNPEKHAGKTVQAEQFSYDEDDVHITPTRCPVRVIRYGGDNIFLVSDKDKDIRQAILDRYGDEHSITGNIRFADPKMEKHILDRLHDGAIEVEGSFVSMGEPYLGTQPLKEEPRISTLYYMNGKAYSLLDAPNGTIGLLSLQRRQANAELFGRLQEAALDIQKRFLNDCGLDPKTPMRFEKADYLVVRSDVIEVRRGDALRARIWTAEDGSLRARNFSVLSDDLSEHRGHTPNVFTDPSKISDPQFFEQFKDELFKVITDHAAGEDEKWALADRAQLSEMLEQKEKGFSESRPSNIDVAIQDIADAMRAGILAPDSAKKADLEEVYARLNRASDAVAKEVKAVEKEIAAKEKEMKALDPSDDDGHARLEEDVDALRDKRIETLARKRLLDLYKLDVATAGSAKEIVDDNKSRVVFLGDRGTRIELDNLTVEEGETRAAAREMKHLSDAHAGNKVPERFRNDIIKDIEKAERVREERSEKTALRSEVKGEPSNGIFIIERDGKMAYADRQLNIISKMYDKLGPMRSLGLATNNEGKAMFIRPDGSEALDGWVDDIYLPGDGASVVGRDGLYNIIDLSSGKLISDQWFPHAGAMSDGWAPIKARPCDGEENSGKWNYINKKGELLLENGWADSATVFKNGKATITRNKVKYTLDKFGIARRLQLDVTPAPKKSPSGLKKTQD